MGVNGNGIEEPVLKAGVMPAAADYIELNIITGAHLCLFYSANRARL